MTKKNSLLAAIALFSIGALFAFTYPEAMRENVLTLLFPEGERPLATVHREPSTVHREPSTVNREPSTVNREPSTVDTFPPLSERYDDFINSGSSNPVDLRDPKAIDRQVEYDAASDMYIITERIGDDFYRAPTYMTFSEYVRWRDEQQQRDYFDRLQGVVSADGKSADGTTDPVSKFNFKNSLIDRLFGGTNVDIKPQGNINLTFGYDWQKIQNPILTLRQQTNRNFDFDMDINMSAQGKIGEKLNLNFNYNTQATFDFDNQMKINYDTKGFSEDEIIQNVEAGNVSMPLRSNLIKGAQNLFGFKTEMKFGHLRTTLVASQQRSKQQSIKVQGGSQVQTFEKPIDEYDENRHFFITHYNRDAFEPAMACLPVPQSLFNITRMEVWITNDKQEFQNTRDVLPLADLGEADTLHLADKSLALINPPGKDIKGIPLPANQNNKLYSKILYELSIDSSMRFSDRVVSILTGPKFVTTGNTTDKGAGMKQIRDFEKMNARLLSSQEYTFNEQLGFVSINLNVQPDQVVGVAMTYTYNGQPYKIGEFSDEVPKKSSIDTLKNNVLFLKMLKSTTANVKFPIWDLMMKNVYAVGTANVDPQEFRFDIYYEDPGKGQKRFLDGPLIPPSLRSRPLLQVFGLDNLNLQGDPGPDGIFDFVPGLTINLRSGRIMFPILEPFGSDLLQKIDDVDPLTPLTPTELAALRTGLIYQQLYDSTTFVAREYQQLNRFMLRGTYKSSTSSEISLGTFNLPPGSVRVTAGGTPLREGIDYSIDYNIGKVRILNDAILQSGQSVNVNFEDNTFFGFQSRSMIGARFDYAFSKDLSVGATFMNLFERPLTQKVNFGDDPINNKVYGLDFSISKDAPWLTKLIDKLPLIETKEPSTITATAEVAVLQPGHNRAINQGGDKGGTVYLDDFEGSTANIPLTTQFNQWVIASVPQGDLDLFPESTSSNNELSLGANRAGLSWYISDPSARDQPDAEDPYTRLIQFQDIFPNRQLTPFEQSSLRPLDVTIFPRDRGPYNFEIPTGYNTSAGFSPNGKLNLPKTRWAGFMKELNTNDFEASNIEFIEFWMLNPYMEKTDGEAVSDAGQMYIDLGSISEDVMRDGRQFFENGLPTGTNNVTTDVSNWGRVPIEPPVVNAFDNNEASRAQQDLGLDGLDDEQEKTFGKIGEWYDSIQSVPDNVLSPNFKNSVTEDPSNDDFVFFRDNSFPAAPGGPGLLNRYRKFNNQQGNSPINQTDNQNPSSTNIPDQEDLNRDRSLNETEAYFRYKIDLKKTVLNGQEVIDENDPVLTEYITNTVTFNKNGREFIWYRFKIPLDDVKRQSIGDIQDFRSVRFIRMFWKGFDERTTFRFATLELGRNQWRRFKQNLAGCGIDVGIPKPIPFDVNAVNIEENSARLPFNYTIPFGISREQSVGAFPDILQNEQSLAMNICSLDYCDARAVFKSLNMDLRQYKRIKMFVHAEETMEQLDTGDLKVFIRMGSDYTRNYYEYELPLVISDPALLNGNSDSRDYKEEVWKNNFDFPLELLTEVKKLRNADPLHPPDKAYISFDPDNPDARVKIFGNPNLGLVKGVMIGIRNSDPDMTSKHCVEAWLNELRVSGFNEKGGFAGLARVDMKLADLGGISLAGNYTGIGWGSIEEKLAQRQREEVIQMDVSTNIELSRFLPEKLGLKIPFYAQYSNVTRNPEFDPYDLDIKLKDKLRETADGGIRDSIRTTAQDVTVVKGYNFTNVRKERRGKPRKVPLPWNIENFSVTYAYNVQEKRTPFIISDRQKQYKGGLDWQYGTGLKPLMPFKKLVKKDKYLKFISEFNFNPLPNTYGFNTNLERFEGITTYRFSGEDASRNTYYNRRFTWDRNYDLGWDISKAIRFNFDANARSLIDEPQEYISEGGPRVTKQERKDSILTNIRSLGRPKLYNHTASLNWTLPFKQIPLLDFVNMKASYTAGYTWTAQSLKLQNLDAGDFQSNLNSRSLGNTIQNNNTRQINGDLNFETLYNKSKYLSKINKPSKGGKGGSSGTPGGNKSGKPGPGGKGGEDDSSPNPDRGGTRPGGKVPPGGGGTDGGTMTPAGKGKEGGAPDRNDPSTPPAPDKNNPGGMNPSGVPLPGGPGGIDPVTGRPNRTRPNPTGADPADPAKGGKDKDPGGKDKKEKGKDKKKEERQPTLAERIALRPLMLVRKARLTYSENRSNVIPGFTPETELLGLSNGFDSPGWGFVSGFQEADRAFLDRLGASGSITNRPELNQQVMKNYTQNLDMGVTIEPFTDFRLEVTANKQYTRNSTELFKDQIFSVDPNLDSIRFEHRAARDLGSYTVSFLSMNTMFNKDIAGLFTRFESYRPIVSDRLAIENGYSVDSVHTIDDGYKKGYGRIHQEVLIPAFLAAYTKKDPGKVGLDIFKTMPAPNWKLSYNGLSKLGKMKDIFASIQITHGYKNTLTVNSYNTDIFYEQNLNGGPGGQRALDSLNFNYTARFEIPQVVINEQFQPLIGVDVKLKNEMTFKLDVKRSRTLSMSFIDYQLSETKSSGFTAGFGYRMKNVNIPFLTGKKNLSSKSKSKKNRNKKKKPGAPGAPPTPPAGGGAGSANDLTFKFDFEVRDDITIAHLVDSPNEAQPTRGARTISLNPQVEYALNKRLKLRLFADYRKTVPKTSQSFPITTLNTGVTVQFSLN